MIHKTNVEMNQQFWYVFVPNSAINLQTVKLEKVAVTDIDDEAITFRVFRNQNGEDFLTVNVTIETDSDGFYPNLFPITAKPQAEMFWAKHFFKNFQEINGIEFSDFVKLYKRIQEENPEWIL